MTDINELAQREKFEAWVEHACAAPRGYLKKRRTTEGCSEQIYTCMWAAWKAAGSELVEALEKAQTINAAAEKLVRCKGRYHSEQNYRALAALFGVKTPDLPPLEHENVHYVDAAEMEIAALRHRIAELETSHAMLRDTLAAIHNTIRLDGSYTPLAAILNRSKNAYEESAPVAGIKWEAE